ncbi:MAG: hypothetical protein FWE15_12890 [Actinomycetia bacterium]|nr:hypothetical protein [Actinomycetes bacterium]MCL2730904.1 hypothetical protein [Actinomycetes bacterium]
MEFERRTVWEYDPVGTPRMPDPVRAAAVRAVLITALALVEAVVDVVLALGESWLSAPVLLFTVFTCVVATWSVLDVWVTRQVWNQRNGVVSTPSSAARALRRDRRKARRAARRTARRTAHRPSAEPSGRRLRIPRMHGV